MFRLIYKLFIILFLVTISTGNVYAQTKQERVGIKLDHSLKIGEDAKVRSGGSDYMDKGGDLGGID